jgi:CHAT domain-containing protein
MEQTPGLPHGYLQYAKMEIEELDKLLRESSIPTVKLMNPKRADILNKVHGSKVFHFAGHGISHRDPSQSSLMVDDWQQNPLAAKDLMTSKLYPNPPFLAYLSACSTGDNQVSGGPDEGISLMSACQIAGFQHVIGSLWTVADVHCVGVAKDVYEAILKHRSHDSVSQGLHTAVKRLRGGSGTVETAGEPVIGCKKGRESPIENPRIWAGYIHVGI